MSLHFTAHVSVVYGFHSVSCTSSPKVVKRFGCGWCSSPITSSSCTCGGGKDALYIFTIGALQAEEKDEQLCMCVCACACTHIPHTDHPTHPLTGILQVPCGCTKAVEGEVLPNRVDPLTTSGHHTHYKVTFTALVRLESTNNLNGWIAERIIVYIYILYCGSHTHTHYTLTYYKYTYVHKYHY